MIGFISGYSDTSVINYCPACGEKIKKTFPDGTGMCETCGMRFGVIELCEEREDENENN